MLKSEIFILPDGGTPERKAIYTLEPKKALVAFVEQAKGNFYTWKYPEELPGMWESGIKKGAWYFNDTGKHRTIAAFPCQA